MLRPGRAGCALLAVLPLLTAGCATETGVELDSLAPATAVVEEVSADGGGATALLAGHYLPTIEDLLASPEVDNIVAGRIESVEYEFVDGLMAYTAMTIAVEGQRNESERSIVVWEAGGQIPVGDLPTSELKLLGLNGDERGVVDYSTDGGDHPAVGDRVLLFIYQVGEPDGTGAFTDSYRLVGGGQGRFVLDPASGDYLRSAVEAGYDSVITAEQARTVVG